MWTGMETIPYDWLDDDFKLFLEKIHFSDGTKLTVL
jgi:hypothetical protein